MSAADPMWTVARASAGTGASTNWSGGNNGAWTPTRLNAAAIRMGFSTDAAPDMGATLVMLEVAIRTAPQYRTLTIGEDEFSADVYVHPYNSAVTSYVITNNHDTQSCQFTYDVSGTPQTPVTVAAGDSTTIDIHADNFGDISNCQLIGV
jgi:hypothetical protein